MRRRRRGRRSRGRAHAAMTLRQPAGSNNSPVRKLRRRLKEDCNGPVRGQKGETEERQKRETEERQKGETEERQRGGN
eukprot:657753-Pleurochrysis_carterae.AAC.1